MSKRVGREFRCASPFHRDAKFIAEHGRQIYCSPECQKKALKKRDRDKLVKKYREDFDYQIDQKARVARRREEQRQLGKDIKRALKQVDLSRIGLTSLRQIARIVTNGK